MQTSNKTEYEWLSTIAELLQKENLDPTDFVSWAAYHANRQPDNIRYISPIAVMPLFTESSNTGAMIMHAMKLVALAAQYLHPGQVPVITMDQPLYAIAKQIQWLNPMLLVKLNMLSLWKGYT